MRLISATADPETGAVEQRDSYKISKSRYVSNAAGE